MFYHTHIIVHIFTSSQLHVQHRPFNQLTFNAKTPGYLRVSQWFSTSPRDPWRSMRFLGCQRKQNIKLYPQYYKGSEVNMHITRFRRNKNINL